MTKEKQEIGKEGELLETTREKRQLPTTEAVGLPAQEGQRKN